VHAPICAVAELCADTLRRLRGMQGVRVDLRERKVAKDDAEALAEHPLQLLQDGMRPRAVRTLVVAVLHDHDRGIRRALDVIFSRDGHSQRGAHGVAP
jgi:hypothetical protein